MPGGVKAAGGARVGGPVGTPETVLSALVTAEDGISWHVFLHAPGPPLGWWFALLTLAWHGWSRSLGRPRLILHVPLYLEKYYIDFQTVLPYVFGRDQKKTWAI